MTDSLLPAAALGLIGSIVAGPLVAYAIDGLPSSWRRTAQWLLIVGAGAMAVGADLASDGPVGGAVAYVLPALPGVLTFLAWRSLLASAIVSLAPLYVFIGGLTRGRPTHVPALPLDQALPLRPSWMLVYGSLYVFVVLMPLLVIRQPDLIRRAMKSYILVMVASYAGFLLYPTAGPRGDAVDGPGFALWSLRLVYALDTPYNCFPSLHVAYAGVAALACHRVHRGVGAAAIAWAALIGVSTLYTKQHYAADVLAGAAEAGVAYVWLLRGHDRASIGADERRRAPVRALAAAVVFAVMVGGFWVAYRLQAGGG